MALTITLNGQLRTFDDLSAAASVAELVAELGLKADRVALELNGEIVARSRWAEAKLADADRLEIVHFVGGGTSTTVTC
jgi:sulfur carrier protein